MLGLNTMKNLALSTAVVGTISKENFFQSMSMDHFWTHSIFVGVIAKVLYAKKGITVQMGEECFVAGMLHDLAGLQYAVEGEVEKAWIFLKGAGAQD